MPDPLEDLENFKQRGLPVNPMPAAEVRRRGDRMRRRNHALAVVGGVAAATVMVATPIAIATDGGARSDQPIPPAGRSSEATDGPTRDVDWRTSVPGEFPLTVGMPERNAHDGSPVETREGYLAQHGIAPCGGDDLDVDHPARVVDAATAVYTEVEGGGIERSLLLYADDQAAAGVLEELRDRFDGDCPAPRNGAESAVQPSSLGEDSLVYVDLHRFGGDLVSSTLHVLVRVGNAVLHHGEYVGGADDVVVRDALNQAYEETAYPVSSMCLFSASPCTEPPAAPEDPAQAAPIPDGFPLALDLPTGDQLIGPGRTGSGIELLDMCGTGGDVWPGERADRLVVTATNGDYLRTRELVTYPEPATATEVVAAIREAAAGCGTVGVDADAESEMDRTYTVLDDGTDADSVAFAMTTRGGEVSALYRFVATGGAVLGSFASGQFTEAAVPTELGELVDQDAAVLDRVTGLAG